MIIAFSAVDRSVNSLLSHVFGRSNYFVIVDTVRNTNIISPNPTKSALGAAGIQTAQFLISQNIDVVVSGQIGNNAMRFLSLAGIKTITDMAGSLSEIIPMVLNKIYNDAEKK